MNVSLVQHDGALPLGREARGAALQPECSRDSFRSHRVETDDRIAWNHEFGTRLGMIAMLTAWA